MKMGNLKELLNGFVIAVLLFLTLCGSSLSAASTIETETAHFIIRYPPGYEAYFEEVAELAESIYEDTTTFMECIPSEKVKVTLQPSNKTFAFAGIAGGGIVMKYGCPFSTESAGRDYLDRKRQIAHEFTHYLLFQRVPALEDPVVTIPCVWISEGTALYASDTGMNELRSEAAAAYLMETNELPSSLKNIYGHPFGGFLSYSVIAFILDVYGIDSFHAFLDDLSEWEDTKSVAENVEKAIQNAFGVTTPEFEDAWDSYLKTFVQDFAEKEKEKEKEKEEKEFKPVAIISSEGRTVVTSWHGNKILFVSSVDRDLNVFVMDEDGTNVQRLTSHLSGDFDAKFSPDGEKIAFTSRRDGYTNIYCMDANGSNVHQLTCGEAIDVMGSWSPDGERIAFTSGRNGNYDVYVMDANGSNVHQLTDHPGSDGWPVFSPDGKTLLFVSDRNNSYDLYTMNTDGTGVTQLTDTPDYENYPVYSPDGKKIAFISKNGKEFEICIMNSDGTQRKPLVPQQWIVEDTFIDSYGVLVWSPDGTNLAFTCIDLVVMVDIPGSGIDPTWVILAGLLVAACVYFLFRYRNPASRKNLEK